MANLFLMSGPCGAGKTTLATRLAKERNLRYLSIEDFYAAFFGSDLVHIHREQVWEAFAIAIRTAMEDGTDVLIDTNSPSRADRDWFIERFPKYTFHLIIVKADKELCLLNNRNRERQIPEEEMESMFKRLEPVTEDELKNYASVELYENKDNSGVKFVEKLV
ncbi:ATP-binding protein [Candidatus Saccharibacteria bacterium]|nr:ATP-binding protein [Candidatus Saccharibacteria bacterium]MBR6964881.1 ATP-binding protein [Candidatus Saccharibacteria bacterium]